MNTITETELNEMEPSEVLEAYMEQNKLHRTEGTTGVKNLETLCGALGYKQGQYVGYGHELINFLADNPGAIQAIHEFISDHISEEQAEELRSEINCEEE